MRSGEDFLASTRRLPAEVLVVEGWIGYEGVDAAAAEFERGGYRYVVASGGPVDDRWEVEHASYAELAGRELIRSGVPQDKVIVAPAPDTERQRTYQSAVAVWRALHARGIRARALNVFTLGPHAGRSRLVFAKVHGPETQVGAIGWVPPEDRAMPWWRSSERAKGLLTETAGYLYEVLLNSGRFSNAPGEGPPPDPAHDPRQRGWRGGEGDNAEKASIPALTR
jgi:hypothetical protein